MTYSNVILVNYDPVVSLFQIRGLTHARVCEADLVVVKRRAPYKATGLFVQRLVTEKNRYAYPGKNLTRSELITIMEQSHRVTVVNSRGVLSEK